MHSTGRLPERALGLARHQAGVLSRAQLLDLGVSGHCIDRLSRDWVRLARGVYLVTPDLGSVPWPARVWAGVLLGGPGARACALTAAALDGLATEQEDLRGRRPRVGRAATGSVHILVPGRVVGPRPGFVFTRERPGVRLISSGQDPARTRIEDTVLDLCAMCEGESLLTWLTRACQRRLTTPERLRRRVMARSTVRHRPLLLDILADVEEGAFRDSRRDNAHAVRGLVLAAVRLE